MIESICTDQTTEPDPEVMIDWLDDGSNGLDPLKIIEFGAGGSEGFGFELGPSWVRMSECKTQTVEETDIPMMG